MKTDFVRIYKSVHTWTGIVSGMALFIAFYAGAITVFKEPLTRWASPPAETHLLALADAQELIVKTLASNPTGLRDFTIHLRDVEHVAGRMSWQVHTPGADEHDESAVHQYMARLDDAGVAHVVESHPSHLASFIDVLHRVIGLPVDSDPNRWLMGLVAALYTLALVSGVVVLLPSLVKDFFALRIGKNLKRMWLDAHNVVGIVSLPFHLIMALTAVVFAYHDGIYFVQDKVVHEGKWPSSSLPQKSAKSEEPKRDPSTMLPPLELVARATDFSPDFEPTMLEYQQVIGSRAVVRIWGKNPAAVSPRARGGFVAVDPYSGKIVNSDLLPGHQSTPNLFISSFFALHMASFGGIAVQWMYFLLGLAGAWLFYTGNLLWVETRRTKASREASNANVSPSQRRDVRMMANATVGVCLGCVCGISLTIAGGKWLYGHVENLDSWHQIIYYGTFFGALVWSFWRGAAQAAIHLLWLAAACTFAIPATSLVAGMLPSLGMWAHGSSAALAVDATGLVGSICFAWLARVTTRRVSYGPSDSIWSARSVNPSPS